MTRSLIRILALLVILPLLAHSAEKYPDMKDVGMPVHRISFEGSPKFYGSAVVFYIENQKVYLLTNAHIVPKDPTLRDKLRYSGALAPQPTPVKVVGIAPGYDLAVLEADHPTAFFDSFVTHLSNAFANPKADNIEELKKPLIFGVSGPEEEQDYFNSSRDWGSLLMNNLPTDVTPASVVKTTDCPAFQLEYCYLTTIPSWGFSGGALFGNLGDPSKPAQILGIVSHYRFLTSLTYVIPMPIALEIGLTIMKTRKDVVKSIVNGSVVTAMSATSLKMENGPFAGKVFTENKRDTQGGGGDVTGGGGGDVAGGGGKLKEANNFFQRGLLSFMTYRPGIRMDNKLYFTASAGTQEFDVSSLGMFLNSYRKNANLKLSEEILSAPIPAFLSATDIAVHVTVDSEIRTSALQGCKFLGGKILSCREASWTLDNFTFLPVGNNHWQGPANGTTVTRISRKGNPGESVEGKSLIFLYPGSRKGTYLLRLFSKYTDGNVESISVELE